MKNKIIAVFTACCMICGAFPLNTVNTANNTISANAVEDSEYERRYGICYMSSYISSDLRFSVKYIYHANYYGDYLDDIDWSKHTDISSTSGIYVYDKGDDIEISYAHGYSNDSVTIYFEDMEVTIDVRFTVMTSTMSVTTTTESPTTTTTTRPVTYTYTYPNTTTATYTYPAIYTYPVTTTTTTTPVPSLMIIPSSVNMKTGDTNRLAVIGAANASDVVWTSGDTSVAAVSDNGTVTAKGSGSTLIYAVYNGNVASCRINVDSTNRVVYGDTNSDGAVDLADAVSIIQHIGNEGKYALSEQGFANADTNGDGKITGADALIIQRIEAKEISLEQLPYKG